MKIKFNKKFISSIFVISAVFLIFSPKIVFAAWDGLPYSPGETNNPECLPSQTDCDVLPAFASPTFTGAVAVNGNINMTGDIIPTADDTYSLGSESKVWKDLFVGAGSIYVNGQEVLHTDANNSVLVSADPTQNLQLITTGGGNLELNPASGGGALLIKGNVVLTSGKTIRTSDLSSIIFSDGVSTPSIMTSVINGGISITPNGLGNTYVTNGNFGVGTTAGLSKLSVNGGLHVGGDSDAGDNNILADGTITAVGAISASNLSGTNTGDNAVNSLYSGLANSKQNTITTGTATQYFKGDLSLGTFPTALSSFTNNLGNYGGFLTSFTELDPIFSNWLSSTPPLYSYTENDPTIYSWAKATTKPTYTATEVGLGNVPNLSFSGSNTGDETQSSIQTKLGVVSSSTSGYLTSVDWNIFNNKQPAGSYITLSSLSGTSPITYNNTTGAIGFTNPGYITSYTETDPIFTAWDKDYSDLTNTPSIPSTLASLSDDATHRLVTDTEKSTWNGKQDALGFTPISNTTTVNGHALSSNVSVTATDVNLGDVTNESKATMFTSPTFTGTVSGITATMVGLGNVPNLSFSGSNTGDNAINSLYSGLVTMTYPNSGIPNSTGGAWGISYTTTGSGTVLALATTPTFTTNITTPLIIGGTAVTDILKLQSTTGNGTLTSPAIQALVGNNGGTVAMTILNNGNVGINNTNPDKLITINQKANRDGIRIYGFASPTDYIEMMMRSTGYGEFNASRGYQFNVAGGAIFAIDGTAYFPSDQPLSWGNAYNYSLMYYGNQDRLDILKGKTRNTDVMMTFLSNKNVGIGTINPQQKLDVAGTIRQSACTTAGTLSANTSGDIVCTPSSLQFKNDRTNLTVGLSTILSLNPVSYTFKPGMNMGNEVHFGFISEEVSSILPELATHDSLGNPYGLDNNAILAVTVNSIKEMNSKLVEIGDANKENDWRTSFTSWFSEKVNGIVEFVAGIIRARDKLCIGEGNDEVCLTKEELRQLKNNSGISNPAPVPPPTPAPEALVIESVVEPELTPTPASQEPASESEIISETAPVSQPVTQVAEHAPTPEPVITPVSE